MAYKCECCEDLQDGDCENRVCTVCTFTKTPGHGVGIMNDINEEWCENCAESNSFYCYFTGNLFSSANFTRGDDLDGDAVCVEAVRAAGWVYDNDEGGWRRPNNEEEQVASNKYVDFYWQLEDGERHGVLQIEDGGEQPMPASLEEKIYHRIDEAGADRGDPSVVNVYTRLQLIDDGILPADYVL